MTTHRLLTVLVIAGVALTACGSDDAASGNATSATTATSAPVDATASAGTSAATGTATVMLATDATLGDHLVDGEGRTLYLFEKDQGTTTACTGGCADTWPPIVADSAPTAGDGVDTAQLGTADGLAPNQVTYHGHLLYHFAGDQAPGDTNGTSIPNWYAVNAAGDAIEPG